MRKLVEVRFPAASMIQSRFRFALEVALGGATKALYCGLGALVCFAFGNGRSVQAGTIYVSNNQGNSITEYSSSGAYLGVFASTGLSDPTGLAFDSSGNLYAANQGTETIEKFNSTGTNLGVFASTGLDGPHALAFDRSGDLYVANFTSSTVVKYSSSGIYLGVFTSTALSSPTGLVLDNSGNLYVANWGGHNHGIQFQWRLSWRVRQHRLEPPGWSCV